MNQGSPLNTRSRSTIQDHSYRIPGVMLSLCSSVLAVGGISFAIFSWHGLAWLLFSIVVGLFGMRMFVLYLGETQPSEKMLVTAQTPWVRSMAAGDVQQSPFPPVQPRVPQNVPSSVSTAAAIIPQQLNPTNYRQQALSPGMYGGYNPQIATTIAMNVPVDEDPLFQLEKPVPGTRCFILPKEGGLIFECQDRYALNAKRGRYAIADGVEGSFVPTPWARILSKNFVERSVDFESEEEFKRWLVICSHLWHMWMEQRWVPTMQALRARHGDKPGDWSDDIRQGAEATLIGCSVMPGSPVRKTSPAIRVFAIGDGEFFLFRLHPENGWILVQCFPYTESYQFGSHPNTLMTLPREDLLQEAWAHFQKISINALAGDRIILASSIIARWLLRQVEQHTDLWVPFLNIIDPLAPIHPTDAGMLDQSALYTASAMGRAGRNEKEFEYYMRQELQAGRIEDDDLTVLSIVVQ